MGAVGKRLGSAGFSAGPAQDISIAIYSGTPYVAYTDNQNNRKATVMRYNGSNWTPVGRVGFTAGSVQYTSIAIDNSGAIYVAMGEEPSYKATVVKSLPSYITNNL